MALLRIGALWAKTTNSGKNILSGPIKCPRCEADYKITVWENNKGDNPKRPDYTITEDTFTPRERPAAHSDSSLDDYRRAVKADRSDTEGF
jgi:uncharacterized protein (DUF736 family)